MLPNQLLDSPPCRFAAKDPWPVPRCGPWPTNGARSAQACQMSWQNLTIDTPAPHTNHLKVPEEPSRPSTDFFHTQTPRCASWNQDPDLPATRAILPASKNSAFHPPPIDCSLTFSLRATSAMDISPASTLNTIRVFFSTGTKEDLPHTQTPLHNLHNTPATQSDARQHQPCQRHPMAPTSGTQPAELARRRRGIDPHPGHHHRPLPRPHDPRRREEGRRAA